jgi:hypothetical protein
VDGELQESGLPTLYTHARDSYQKENRRAAKLQLDQTPVLFVYVLKQNLIELGEFLIYIESSLLSTCSSMEPDWY